MKYLTWQTQNKKAIAARLQSLQEQSDGTLFFEPSGLHFISLTKKESKLQLALLEQESLSTQLLQSQLDLADPLNLLSPYTQAMVLGLVWNSTPKRIYMAGLGGGRIPLVLHHYCPQARVECTEIDPTLLEVATRFFGVELDDRFQVAIQDGRQYLESQPANISYDFIAVDVVLGNGYMPYRLVTQEFYQHCKYRLSESGAIAVNLLSIDKFYPHKIKTLKSIFQSIYVVRVPGGNRVAIASDTPLTKIQIIARSQTLQAELQLSFPLKDRADEIITDAELLEEIPDLESVEILKDSSPPDSYFDSLPTFKPVFSQVNPSHPCPCGSGKLYGKCHGDG